MITCIRAFYGLSACSLVMGLQDPYVYLISSVRFTCGPPRGPCGFHTGMGTSVRSVLRESYGPVRIAGLGISVRSVVQGLTGSGEARECTLGLYLPSQTRLCDMWPIRARKTTNWLSMGTKSLVAHVLKVVHAQPSAAGYTAKFKIRNIVRTRNACRVTSHVLTQAWPLRGP